jgi:hypothetical protein
VTTTPRTQAFKSQPENQNVAQPTRFQMVASRLPHTTFWCQTVILPSISTGYAMSPTLFVDQKLPGDKLVYAPLTLTMLVDEDLMTYMEIHDWLRGMTFPTDFAEYRNLKNLSQFLKHSSVPSNQKPQYSDLAINIYNNNWQQIMTWKFYDSFPTSLGELSYTATETAATPMLIDVTFEYQYYDIVRSTV